MIHGYFDPRFNGPRPMVRAAVFIPTVTATWVTLDFLLDTGASTTCIHPADALFRVGIPAVRLATPGLWPKTEPLGGIGGTANFFPMTAWYFFWDDSDAFQPIQGEVRIAQLTASNQAVPSLLGWDVLQRFTATIHWPSRRIELT